MMVAREPVKKLTTEEHFKLVRSPDVKILVGPDEVEFLVPRDLLGYYSPFFKACFSSPFKEGIEQVCRLPEDKPEWFAVIRDYLHRGEAVYVPKFAGRPCLDRGVSVVVQCLDFIRFADRIDMIEAASAVAGILRKVFHSRHYEFLESLQKLDRQRETTPEAAEIPDFWETIGLLPVDSPTLKVIAVQCLKVYNKDEFLYECKPEDIRSVELRVRENASLAAAMMRLLRPSRGIGTNYPDLPPDESNSKAVVMWVMNRDVGPKEHWYEVD